MVKHYRPCCAHHSGLGVRDCVQEGQWTLENGLEHKSEDEWLRGLENMEHSGTSSLSTSTQKVRVGPFSQVKEWQSKEKNGWSQMGPVMTCYSLACQLWISSFLWSFWVPSSNPEHSVILPLRKVPLQLPSSPPSDIELSRPEPLKILNSAHYFYLNNQKFFRKILSQRRYKHVHWALTSPTQLLINRSWKIEDSLFLRCKEACS